MNHQEIVIVVDFGGQYSQLIARRIRECGVYCEILPYTKTAEEILAHQPRELYCQAGLPVSMLRGRPGWILLFFSPEYLFSEFVTECSSCVVSLEDGWPVRKNMNMGVRLFSGREIVLCLKKFRQKQQSG